jgi:sulfate permease, SulP family
MSKFVPDPGFFRPRLVEELKAYDRGKLASDVFAGVTVGVVALPLAMAFAIASGVKPEAGLFTAIIAGFLISALGGSRVQIGGPAGAFIVIIYGIIQQYGLANLIISTFLAGGLLFAMGLTKVGGLVRFVPVGIIVGFTNGIAVLIIVSQIKDFLGLQIERMPADFFGVMAAVWRAIGTVSGPTVAVAVGSLAVILAWPRLSTRLSTSLSRRLLDRGDALPSTSGRVYLMTKLPATIVALVLATAIVAFFQLPVETIGSRYGGIPRALPALSLPSFDWETARGLLVPTLTIALLGAIESLLCARVADNMIDDRHDPNQELMAQGVANMVTPLFGGIPATGTIARTTTNVRSGARTPVAGIVHALTLLAIVLVAAPLATHVPLAALAAILLFVAYNMGEWREFARLKQFSFNYRAVMLSTFFLTVVFDLTVAVQVGLTLASLFFIFRIASVTSVEPVGPESLPAGAALPPGVAAYRIFGSLFFGAVGKLEMLLDMKRDVPRVTILDLHHVINMDTTGLETLDTLRRALARRGSHLVLCDVNAQPASLLRRGGLASALGEENIQPDLSAALARAIVLVSSP